jgi:hypothetical protein
MIAIARGISAIFRGMIPLRVDGSTIVGREISADVLCFEEPTRIPCRPAVARDRMTELSSSRFGRRRGRNRIRRPERDDRVREITQQTSHNESGCPVEGFYDAILS